MGINLWVNSGLVKSAMPFNQHSTSPTQPSTKIPSSQKAASPRTVQYSRKLVVQSSLLEIPYRRSLPDEVPRRRLHSLPNIRHCRVQVGSRTILELHCYFEYLEQPCAIFPTGLRQDSGIDVVEEVCMPRGGRMGGSGRSMHRNDLRARRMRSTFREAFP